jgi:3-(3-hydroxy-phenyl)propionate hydroxylase
MIMPGLIIEPNMAQPDDFYEALIQMHRELTPEQSEMANAHLILLLANHVGDPEVLRDAMNRARALVPDVPS